MEERIKGKAWVRDAEKRLTDNEEITREVKRQTGRGGRREGAGRPKGDSRLYSFRAPAQLAKGIEAQANKTEFIRTSIEHELNARAASGREGLPASACAVPDSRNADACAAGGRWLGETVPAFKLAPLELPFFDIRIVAGFPVPLDNDEKSQDIDILRLLCPHPESSYLIRVNGDSMIDAGIISGDIVIVDKSRRTPEAREIAVCELNGEYTLKHLVEENGQAWLVPANPDYPRIAITDGDSFSVWGTVTYIIHKARD